MAGRPAGPSAFNTVTADIACAYIFTVKDIDVKVTVLYVSL